MHLSGDCRALDVAAMELFKQDDKVSRLPTQRLKAAEYTCAGVRQWRDGQLHELWGFQQCRWRGHPSEQAAVLLDTVSTDLLPDRGCMVGSCHLHKPRVHSCNLES